VRPLTHTYNLPDSPCLTIRNQAACPLVLLQAAAHPCAGVGAAVLSGPDAQRDLHFSICWTWAASRRRPAAKKQHDCCSFHPTRTGMAPAAPLPNSIIEASPYWPCARTRDRGSSAPLCCSHSLHVCTPKVPAPARQRHRSQVPAPAGASVSSQAHWCRKVKQEGNRHAPVALPASLARVWPDGTPAHLFPPTRPPHCTPTPFDPVPAMLGSPGTTAHPPSRPAMPGGAWCWWLALLPDMRARAPFGSRADP
jgi:hypothetical protein